MTPFETMRATFGRGLRFDLFGPRRAVNTTGGVNDPAFVATGEDIAAFCVEMPPADAAALAGGPVASKLATLYLTLSDAEKVMVGDYVRVTRLSDEARWAYRVASEVALYEEPLPHGEALCESVARPPEEVLGV